MSDLGFGVVGTGFIAGIVANAIIAAKGAKLSAVSSRKIDNARAFVAERPGAAAVEGIDALLARDDVGAVYVATPTAAKEAVALSAIAAGKHVLVDKPLLDADSVRRMTEAASAKGVLFMDATHFVHHPRTEAILAGASEKIGQPKSLHTTFYFPFDDRENIRFDLSQEPMGAVGDMAWYSMRAVVEYLHPEGALSKVAVVPEFDPTTGAVIRVSGLVGFESGEAATFDVGYTAGTAIMDLGLLGTGGMISMDDFVLDWNNSFAFNNAEIPAGYTYRSGMADRSAFAFVETPAEASQDSLMIQHFAEVASAGDRTAYAASAKASLATQRLLDAVWRACQTGADAKVPAQK
ncbi:Gfo/Idh/MocA family oxidoreductase [Mameliella alba]|nr:Gfo/Idh/MocA family oxidoreductase [Mameliella alba]MBY6170009.1 Gfo/Idh/MocA family oxidoreductase [Mameliella alba]MBY6175014.1 Gfo/Idh/MocA family oxidoreductase [Mameliella alba]